jgi:tetratricopeptide (TPR) repeat protein
MGFPGMNAVRTLWVLGALLLFAPSSAGAQTLTEDAEAQMHFEMGRRYYESGRFPESAEEFERAYALSHLPALLYNLYLAYRDAGNDPEAARVLRSYVDSLPEDDEQRVLLAARLRTLEERVASARAASSATTETTATTATTETAATTETTETSTTATTEATVDDGATSVAEPTAEAAPAPRSHDLAVVGGAVGGVGVALVLASIGTGVAALGERSALSTLCPMNECAAGFEDARDRGQTLAIATDALWIGGTVAAVTGLALLLVDLTAGDDVAAAAACTDSGCSAVVGGSF